MIDPSKVISKFYNNKWKFKPLETNENGANNEQFVFIHIPKTAGTTFRFILYNHFQSKFIYPTQEELKANNGLYLNPDDLMQQKSFLEKSMIVGHFQINVIHRIKNDQIKKLTFFRNPLDRILSTIKHIKSFDKEFVNADVNTILEKNWKRIMYAQSMAMGFRPKKRNMKLVRQNIEDLDFVGITEYFDESVRLCNAIFNWELENIEPRNVIKEDVFSALSAKSKMKISRELGPEIQTYRLALNHFRSRCKEHQIQLSE